MIKKLTTKNVGKKGVGTPEEEIAKKKGNLSKKLEENILKMMKGIPQHVKDHPKWQKWNNLGKNITAIANQKEAMDHFLINAQE